MPRLTIRIKKKPDGSGAISCTRADGTVTWQRQTERHAGFFSYHDLTHYAVETVLGHRRGFYGLVAEGWDFEDFGSPWPRGPIPADADPSELIVGTMDAQRASGSEWTLAEVNDHLTAALQTFTVGAVGPTLTEEELKLIRRRMRELFAQWEAVQPGGTLELPFPPDPVAA
jgi:hypothetical protein